MKKRDLLRRAPNRRRPASGSIRAFTSVLLFCAALAGRAAEAPGRYFVAEGAESGGGGVLEVTARHPPGCTLGWRLDSGRQQRALGLSDAGNLLAASINTGGAAYGLLLLRRSADGWKGRWVTSIDGAGTLGDMSIAGATLPGRHHFSGRGRAGSFEGSVTITARGPAFSLNFNSASGVQLYRGIGALEGDRLAVAWSFGGAPSLAVYAVADKGLTGQRFTFARGRNDAVAVTERLTREGADDTIFPPLLPTPSGRAP